MNDTKSVTIVIAGQKFTLNTNASDERVRRITTILNHRLEAVSSKMKNVAPYNAAILMAINLANDFLELEENNSNLKSEVVKKSEKVLDLLEAVQSSE